MTEVRKSGRATAADPVGALTRRAVGLARRGWTRAPAPARRVARALARRAGLRRGSHAPPAVRRPPAPAGRRALTSRLHSLVLRPDGRLALEGWAFRLGADDPPGTALVAVGPKGTAPVPIPLTRVPREDVNTSDDDRNRDRSGTAFTAVVDPAALADADPEADHQWRIEVGLLARADADAAGSGPQPERTEPFGRADRYASTGLVSPVRHGDRVVSVRTGGREGFVVRVERPAVLVDRITDDGPVVVHVQTAGGFRPVRALAVREDEPHGRADHVRLGYRRGRVLVDPARLVPEPSRWRLELVDALGRHRVARWASPDGNAELLTTTGAGTTRLDTGDDAVLRIERGTGAALVTDVRLDGADAAAERLLVRVSGLGKTVPTADAFRLVGPRQTITAERVDVEDAPGDRPAGALTVAFTLRAASGFGGPVLPPGTGRWELEVSHHGREPEGVRLSRRLAGRLGDWMVGPSVRVRAERTAQDALAFRISPTRPVGEAGRFRAIELSRASRTESRLLLDAVLFASFDGRSVGDNPAAIRHELVRRRPDLTEYWVVAEHSVPVPDGAVPVLDRSREFYELRSRARWFVTNAFPDGQFLRRDGQRVLQTWHGTPLKRLGTDRIGFADTDQRRRALADQTAQWSWLISQNPHSTEVFRRAYLYEGTVAEIGYPRNDALTRPLTKDEDRELRSRLGLAPAEPVVLFMPTWRETGDDAITGLDLDWLVRGLGGGHRVLVRGHANTVAAGRDVRADRVVDVTTYPELSDLLRLADVLVTDYSSVMFDYSVTRRPMVFFVPDLEAYAGRDRGVYFDLADRAPGPLVTSTDAVVEEIRRAAGGVPPEHAEAYARWVADFNPWDDGGASARAVDLLLAD
ncbi:CDP-glycerol glycerophosphotransferase (TagB/SpsB family) [Friedmanniella endophytica]|uniref:CDP-glycerol glycerophosphotransferase (TagB/SpsB family) n=1 Tax=Microlunatus kandeliicorticis TaxID=1759536 RepID=A0A7W3ITJ8_9ACTN|nr:CDP-glycerol glycerophosphotransferase family protein [Microlunatus kandeliicorticis]MBA8795007.1 CDP-glycerol glycerophosphotransferase (TagB/SpsB family) [Microlunatus kandeliicorticis]